MTVLPAQHFVMSEDGNYFSAQPGNCLSAVNFFMCALLSFPSKQSSAFDLLFFPVPLPSICPCGLTSSDSLDKHKRDCPTRMPKLKRHEQPTKPDVVKCEPSEMDHCDVLNAQAGGSNMMHPREHCELLQVEPGMPTVTNMVKSEYCGNEQGKQHFPHIEASTPTFLNGEKKLICNICGKACDSKGFRRHVLSHSEERPFVCSECGDSFAQNSALQRHIMSHTGEKPFICGMCGEGFKVNYHLKRHYMTHTGIKPFTCTECGEKFSRNSHLKRHTMIHTGEKPFPCTQCGKRFLNNNHLKRHYLTHTGEKPHVCTECGERFSRGSHLKRHLMLHSGDKPFSCDECGQMFIHLHALRTHHLTHSSDKPFACDVCGKRFMDESHLKRHLTTHETQMFVPLVSVKNPYEGGEYRQEQS